jgi:hypothetical protein
LGGIEALRTIGTLPILSIRFLEATEAGMVLRDIGTQPIAGAIVISTRDEGNRTPLIGSKGLHGASRLTPDSRIKL